MVNDVPSGSSPVVSEDLKTQDGLPVAPVVTTSEPTPGSKTPETNLLAALHEERRLRKEAEDKLNNLTTTTHSDEVFSDEGKALKSQIDSLQELIERKDLEEKFPALKELSQEFSEFKKDYPRHKGENIAKIFLQEKGMLEPKRKGLESPTGGRAPVASDMTVDEVKHLRETDYRRYADLLKKGLIKV